MADDDVTAPRGGTPYRDEWGRRIGWCNSCGEEALLDTECCEDGEVVPYDGDTEADDE